MSSAFPFIHIPIDMAVNDIYPFCEKLDKHLGLELRPVVFFFLSFLICWDLNSQPLSYEASPTAIILNL